MDVFELEHVATYRLLRARGIDPLHATEEQYLDAAETVLAATATAAAPDPTVDDAVNARTLSRFNVKDGRHIADLGIDEADFLAAAVAEQERLDLELAAVSAEQVAADGFGGVIDGARARTIANEYCDGCGYHLADFGCQCGASR